MSEDRKQPKGLIKKGDLIDDFCSGPDPDVQVIDLSDDDDSIVSKTTTARKSRGQRQRGKWLDIARTMVWEGKDTDNLSTLEDVEPLHGTATDPDPPRALEYTDQPGLKFREDSQVSKVSPLPQSSTDEKPESSSQNLPVLTATLDVDVPDDYRDTRYPYESDEEYGVGSDEVPQLEQPQKITFQTIEQFTPNPRLSVLTNPESKHAEQYRVLSLRLRDEHNLQVISITSPTTLEGLHIVATNLALALSEGSRSRVVLLDVNLRGISISELFSLDPDVDNGLGVQIREQRRNSMLSWKVLKLSSNLSFLPSGPPEKNPSTLLNSEVLFDLMNELRRYFDFIIIAMPPILESADVNILQDFADGAVLVARVGFTTRDSIAKSINRLGENRFVGTVLIDAKVHKTR